MSSISAINNYNSTAIWTQYYNNMASRGSNASNTMSVEPVSKVAKVPQDVPIKTPVPVSTDLNVQQELPTSGLQNATDIMSRMRIQYDESSQYVHENVSSPMPFDNLLDVKNIVSRMQMQYNKSSIYVYDNYMSRYMQMMPMNNNNTNSYAPAASETLAKMFIQYPSAVSAGAFV